MKRHKSKYASFSAEKEALSKIKINLDFIDIEKNIKCIMITSAVPNEGKSFIAANIAKSIASGDKKVLLIDADMRNATLQKLFPLENRSGLSAIIASKADWKKSLNNTDNANLHIISSGRTPPNPTELLSSKQMKNMILEMKQDYDFIIIDTPPILPVSDAIALSAVVDGVLLVTRWGKTAKQLVIEAKHALTLANAPLIGAILNDVRPIYGEYYYNY